MKLSAATMVLRPRGVMEVLDLALKACHRDRAVYRRLSSVTLLPALVLCVAICWRVPAKWGWLVAVPLGVILEGAFTAVAGDLMFADGARVRAGLRQYWRRLPAHMLARGTAAVLMAIMTVVLCTPLVGGQLLFVGEMVQLERASGFAALWRSSKMQRLGAQILTWLALTAARLVFVAAFVIFGLAVLVQLLQILPPERALPAANLLALTGWFASIPFVAVARFLAYIDARTRLEGWDLQLRFATIADADQP